MAGQPYYYYYDDEVKQNYDDIDDFLSDSEVLSLMDHFSGSLSFEIVAIKTFSAVREYIVPHFFTIHPTTKK